MTENTYQFWDLLISALAAFGTIGAVIYAIFSARWVERKVREKFAVKAFHKKIWHKHTEEQKFGIEIENYLSEDLVINRCKFHTIDKQNQWEAYQAKQKGVPKNSKRRIKLDGDISFKEDQNKIPPLEKKVLPLEYKGCFKEDTLTNSERLYFKIGTSHGDKTIEVSKVAKKLYPYLNDE